LKRTMFRVLFTAFTIVIVLTLISRSLVITTLYDWFVPNEQDAMLQKGILLTDFMEDRVVEDVTELISPGILMFIDTLQEYRVWVTDPTGKILYDNQREIDKNWENQFMPEEIYGSLRENDILDSYQPSPWGRNQLRTVGLPIYSKETTIGYVLLFDTDRQWMAFKESFNDVLLISGLVSLALALLVTRWMSHRLLVPIYRIEEFVRRLGRKDFDSSLEDPGIVELSGFVATLKTISVQLKNSFQSVEKQEKLLRLVLESLGEGVIVVTKQHRVLMANEAFYRWFSVQPEPYIPLGQSELPVELIEAIRGEQAETRLEYRGRIYVLDFARLPRAKKPSEMDAYGVYVLRDLTEQEQTDQVRQQFVANVSHELRTPLTGISSLVEALRDGVIPPDQHAKYLDMLFHETRRLGRLTSDLIEITKLGSFDPRTRDALPLISLEELFESILWKISSRLKERQQECRVDAEGLRVWGDLDWMEQIFLNLLDNAIRFTPNGKEIKIRASYGGSGLVTISVEDPGIGIPEEAITRIWDRFYKVDEARTRGTGGSGLGLSIVKQLVERQEGEISVSSEYGYGTTFTLVFPGNDGQSEKLRGSS
jgi:signal transduction histidine kinase